MRSVHLSNTYAGLGDMLCCLWAVQALVDQGFDVHFYTKFHEVAKLWHPQTQPPDQAPQHARVIYGRQNEHKLTMPGMGLSRLGIICRTAADAAGLEFLAPVQPRLQPGLPEFPGFQGVSWGPELKLPETVLLFPFCHWAIRDWPFNHWFSLQNRLEAAGLTTLAIALEKDKTLLSTFKRWAYEMHLPLLVALIRDAGLVVTNDSGPLHLAAALGRPTVAIHAVMTPEVLTADYPSVTSLFPTNEGTCAGCHWRPEAGCHDLCARACCEIATIPPALVAKTVLKLQSWRHFPPKSPVFTASGDAPELKAQHADCQPLSA